ARARSPHVHRPSQPRADPLDHVERGRDTPPWSRPRAGANGALVIRRRERHQRRPISGDGQSGPRRVGDDRGGAASRGVARGASPPRFSVAASGVASPPAFRTARSRAARRARRGQRAQLGGGALMTEVSCTHPPVQLVRAIIQRALDEDIAWGDVTTDSAVAPDQRSRADLLAKADGVLCGGRVFAETFALIDAGVNVDLSMADGARMAKGDIVARIAGPTRAILTGERTALNFVQRL